MAAPTVTVRRPVARLDLGPVAGRSRAPSSRRLLAVGGLALLALGLLSGNPALVLMSLTLVLTGVLTRWMPSEPALATAPVLLVALAVLAGTMADAADADLLARPGLLAGVYVLLAVGGAVDAVLARPSRQDSPAPTRWLPGLAAAPAVVAVATGVAQSLSTGIAKSWAFWSTDLVHHVLLVGDLQRHAVLDYDTATYPRGLHFLAALGSVTRAPLDDRTALLEYDLRLVAALTWLGLAALLWAGAVVARHVGRAVGLPEPVPTLAALLFGTGALLTNTFLSSFVAMGAVPSLVAAAALWTAPIAATLPVRTGLRIPLLVGACAVTGLVLGHLWGALVAAPVAALAVCAAGWLPKLPARLRAVPGRAWPALAVLVAGCVVVGTIPLRSVQENGGIAMAGTPGRLPGEPWLLLALSVLVLPVLLRRLRQEWARLYLGSALGLVAAFAVILRATGSLDVHQWYPLKALWFVTVFLAPLLALVTAGAARVLAIAVWRLLGRISGAAFVLRWVTAAVAATAAFALWLPFLLGGGSVTAQSWHHAETGPPARGTPFATSQTFDIGTRYADRFLPAVAVPYQLGESARLDPLSTHQVSELFHFQTGQPVLHDAQASVCEAIGTVAPDRSAVVVSKLSPRRVRREMALGGCAGRAEVEHVPGPLADVIPLAELRTRG